jgi:hypothetical protein
MSSAWKINETDLKGIISRYSHKFCDHLMMTLKSQMIKSRLWKTICFVDQILHLGFSFLLFQYAINALIIFFLKRHYGLLNHSVNINTLNSAKSDPNKRLTLCL